MLNSCADTIHRYDKGERMNYFNSSVNLYPYLKANFAPALQAANRVNTTTDGGDGLPTRVSKLDMWLSRATWTNPNASKKARGCWGL